MNERIKELERRAIEYANQQNTFEPRSEFSKKLAELIIRECIRVPYDMWDKAELNADIAVKIEHRIKEHFGVEE